MVKIKIYELYNETFDINKLKLSILLKIYIYRERKREVTGIFIDHTIPIKSYYSFFIFIILRSSRIVGMIKFSKNSYFYS